VELGADLAITQLKADMAADGRSATITDLIVNRGLLPAVAPGSVRYYLSTDGVIQPEDLLFGERPLPALAAGQPSTTTTRWPLPTGMTAGTYYLLGRVAPPQAGNGPADNDYWGSSLTLGPDLTFGALSARIDPERRQLLITGAVKNAGFYRATTPIMVDYALLPDGGVTKAAIPLGRQELAGELAPGDEQRAEQALPLPDVIAAGRYRVVGQIDPLQRALESRRDNNQTHSDWIVVGYDLTVDQVAAESSSDGLELRVTDTVVNRGVLPAAGHVTVRYLLQEEAPAGGRAEVRQIGQRVIERGLSPGERSTETVTVRLPEGAAQRSWRVAAEAAAGGIDIQPQNDRRTTTGRVNDGVDLAIGRAKAVVSSKGDQLTVTDTVNNYGRAALERPIEIVYTLSADGSAEGQGVILGRRTIIALPAGGASVATTTLSLPASLESRSYFVVIQADPDRRVAEVRRDNNVTAGGRVAVGPQPVLEAVKAQLGPDGASMAVTLTVVNRGNRPMSGPQPVSFGMALDDAGKERMMELGRNIITPLEPGGRATPAYTLPVPATLPPGAYFVTVRLEEGAAEQIAVTPAVLTVGPDLASRELRAELIGQGEQLKVSVTDMITNQGTRGVDRPFTVSYWLSADWKLDRQDLLLGRRTIERLPAGEQHSATMQLAVPVQTIETGQYFVLSRIDLEGAVEESQRTNNLRPTVEGLLIERLEKKKSPDMPEVISGR
jgi:hypothetical protein